MVPAEKSVEVALVKVWSAVQLLALARLRPTLCAVEPLYEPENVREPLVAVREFRLEPRETPEMLAFASWLFPIVLVETNDVPLKLRELALGVGDGIRAALCDGQLADGEGAGSQRDV